eukprot:53083-Pelagomonas_calceolata.AAC.1
MQAEETLPTSIKGKGDTLAQESLESPPPQSYKKKIIMGPPSGIWWVIQYSKLEAPGSKT